MAVDNTKLNRLNRRYEALREQRGPWDAAWRDLADHFLPTKFRADWDSGDRRPEILNRRTVDATGILDMRTLAAGMQGGMTSPVRPWFKLSLQDEAAAQSPEAGAWLDEVTRRMQSLLHNSNFYNCAHGLYGDLGTFGTGLLFETADWSGLRFQLIPAGTYALDVDEHGDVDTLFRRMRMTARQLVMKFGESNLPESVRRAADTPGQAIAEFDVIHGVFPRADRDSRKKDAAHMPFASVYWLRFGQGGGRPHILRESGFMEFPAFAPRWDGHSGDVYGRSPAMDVLPDCRMLQQMGITTLKAIHKAVDPPLVAAAALQKVGVDLTPGGLNYISGTAEFAPGVVPVQQIAPQIIQAGEAKIEAVRQKIHDGLYADLFKMLLLSDRRQITATEIAAREEEKLVLIGPVVERLAREFLAPVVLRTFSLMQQHDYLPPVPDSLGGAPLRVEFVSVLAQAQRMVSTSPIDQSVAFAATAGQMAPEVLDNLDMDKALHHYVENVGAPASLLRPEAEVQKLREARAQAQAQAAQEAQTQAAMQQAVDLSGAAKNLGQTPLGADGQTAMDALLGGMGGM